MGVGKVMGNEQILTIMIIFCTSTEKGNKYRENIIVKQFGEDYDGSNTWNCNVGWNK